MTLLERALKLTESLQQLEKTRQLADDVEKFSTRATELEVAVREFSSLLLIVKAFRNRAIPFILNVDLINLRKTLETVTTGYRDNPNILNPDSNLNKIFWNPLKNSPTSIRESLEIAWRNYTNSILPKLDSELLGFFDNLPSTQSQVKTIRQLQQRFYELTVSLPKNEQDIDKLKQLLVSIQTVWQSFETTEIPASVLAFLKAVYSGGAALDLFTDEVRQWLAKKQLNHFFSISMASR